MGSMMHCPFCNGEFEENQPLEEVLNPTATVIKHVRDRSTWHEIAGRIENGQARMMFNVGDSVECTLKDGRKVLIDVAGIDTYDNDEVIFCFREPIKNYHMNETRTNVGGFPRSDMCSHMNTDILALLPDDLREVITPRKITQRLNGTEYSCEVKLWLPSVVEVGGADYAEYSCEVGEDKQFEIFKKRSARIKYDEDDYAQSWWERSPNAINSTNFLYVSRSGYPLSSNIASNTIGVVPCFSIKKKRDDEENE